MAMAPGASGRPRGCCGGSRSYQISMGMGTTSCRLIVLQAWASGNIRHWNRNTTHRGIMRKMNEKPKHRHHWHASTNEHLPKLPELTLRDGPIHEVSPCQPKKWYSNTPGGAFHEYRDCIAKLQLFDSARNTRIRVAAGESRHSDFGAQTMALRALIQRRMKVSWGAAYTASVPWTAEFFSEHALWLDFFTPLSKKR